MKIAKPQKPLSLDRTLIKHSAWLGAKISFVVLAPIAVFCWLAVGGVFLYKCVQFGVSPATLLHVMDQSDLAKIVDGLIAASSAVVLGVVLSAGVGTAVAASAVGCHKLRGRFARHILRD